MLGIYDNEMKLEFISKSANEAFCEDKRCSFCVTIRSNN